MKYLIVAMVLGVSLYAGEMDRIEAIVQDIENLREEYNVCKKELESKTVKNDGDKYQKLLNKEKLKNTVLEAKNEMLSEQIANSKKLNNKNDKSNNKEISSLLSKENKQNILIKEYKKEIESKDKEIVSLKNQINKKILKKELQPEVCKDDNPFPKLVMKEKNKKIKKVVVDSVDSIELETTFKASAFRLNKDSDIYDSIDGKILYTWEKRRSFTSSTMTQNWIKITGYFVDKEWRKADKELWVIKTNTIKR